MRLSFRHIKSKSYQNTNVEFEACPVGGREKSDISKESLQKSTA